MGITINNNGNCKKSINVNDKNKRFERNYYHKILMAKIWQIFSIPNLYNVLLNGGGGVFPWIQSKIKYV